MLKSAAILLAAVYLTSTDVCYVYEKSTRPEAVCESSKTLTGIYEGGSFNTDGDICITYLTEGDTLSGDFLTRCEIEDKLPLIILRPTEYSEKFAKQLAARLAGFNAPVLVQIDSSLSSKYKDFFRKSADIIHARVPSAAVVWGISSDKTDKLSTLYPGDNYADWVALNMFEGADKNGIYTDPYPLYNILSYFEKSKPVIINLSVASYSSDGHKYFITEAAYEIERVYSLPERNAAIKAVNYISRATPKGSAELENSQRLKQALANGINKCGCTQNIRLPVAAYNHNGAFYCTKGIVPTGEEYCIINNKRCYKIENAGRYVFVRAQ